MRYITACIALKLLGAAGLKLSQEQGSQLVKMKGGEVMRRIINESQRHGPQIYEGYTVSKECAATDSIRVSPGLGGCANVDSGGRRKVLLFGAMGRHNFGDLLMPWMVETLLQKNHGFCPDDFLHADVVAKDMTQYGGHNVLSVGSMFNQSYQAKLDVIHTGGETLGMCVECAFASLPPGSARCNLEGLRQQLAYVLPKKLFADPGLFIANSIGGRFGELARKSDLKTFDYCTLRDAVDPAVGEVCQSAPDSVVMINTLFGSDLKSRLGSDVFRFSGKKFFALQFNHNSSLSDKFVNDFSTVAREHHADGIVLFCAGAAPGHDDINDLRRMKERLGQATNGSIDVDVFEGLNIWDISALISKSSLVVSTSLHCRIIAFSCNVPRVTLGDIPKVKQFISMWDSGMQHQYAPADDIGLSAREALLPNSTNIFRTNAKRAVARYTEAFHGWASKLGEQWGRF